MNEIVVGDSGTVLELTIQDQNGILNLQGAVVDVIIRYLDRRVTKSATIKDASKGVCEVTLDSTDIMEVGNYNFQAHVKFINNTEFSSNIQRFSVGKQL